MIFIVTNEMDAAVLKYAGFEITDVTYDPKTFRRRITFDVPETTETCGGAIKNEPAKMLAQFNDNDLMISDAKTLLAEYTKIQDRVVKTKRESAKAKAKSAPAPAPATK